MAKRDIVRKFALNNVVTVLTGLPNLGINLGTQFVLDVLLHWTGFYALLAYLIGTGVSIQYSVIYSMLVRANFTILGRHYSFSHKGQNQENKTHESNKRDSRT
jgi:hypothetical protein